MIICEKTLRHLAVIVLVLGAALRVLYLDADPQYYAWSGYISDEGRWIYQAREMFLFRAISSDQLYEIHLVLAPLFQLVNYFLFNLIGSSGISSRIFTAFCGSALLLLFWIGLHRKVTPQALFAGLILLAVQVDFVVLSRLAVPEMVTIFFQALVFFGLVARDPSRQRMAVLGVLTLIAVGMKATIVFVLGIFSLMILFTPNVPSDSAGRSSRWQNLLWYWCGIAAPLIIASVIWVGCCAPESRVGFGELSGALHFSMLSGFVQLSSAYSIVSFFFRDSLNPALYVFAFGLWLSWLGWIAADREDVDAVTKRYLVTSTIWIVAYLALMLTLDYFPRRYMVHIVLPMAINVTVGVSLLQKVGIHSVLSALQCKDRFRFLRLVIFVLPSAVFLAPLVVSSFALGGIDPHRLLSQLASVALAVAGTTYVVGQLSSRDNALKFFIAFPLIQVCLWVILSNVHTNALLWPTANGDLSRLPYLGSVAVATVAASLITFAGRGAVIAVPRVVTIYALGYLVASTVRLAPAYIEPHFTIRDASRELSVLLEGSSSIFAHRAEGLFSDNVVRYRRFDVNTAKDDDPEIIVTAFDDPQRVRDFLEKHYYVETSRVLYVSPQIHEMYPTSLLPALKVYKKKK